MDILKDRVENLANELSQKYSITAIGYEVDITDEKQIKSNLQKIKQRFGKIDGLVNNAANNPKMEEGMTINFSRLENFMLDSWERDIAVGLTGAFLCAKY